MTDDIEITAELKEKRNPWLWLGGSAVLVGGTAAYLAIAKRAEGNGWQHRISPPARKAVICHLPESCNRRKPHMKAKLIYIFIALLLPILVFAQEWMPNKKMGELLARIKQVPQDRPDAERHVQRLLAEWTMDVCSPLALRELSRLLRQDAPEEPLRRQLELLTERYGRDHRDRQTEPRSSLPVITADNQPLTAAQ